MGIKILTDTSDLPFASTPGEWFNCYYLPGDEMVFIRHPVIIALMKHRGEDVMENPVAPPGSEGTDGANWAMNCGPKYSEYANGLGTSIGRYLEKNGPGGHGTALEFYLPDYPFPMLLGFFGGKTFVFFDERD